VSKFKKPPNKVAKKPAWEDDMVRLVAIVATVLIGTMLAALPARAADKVVLMLNWYVYGEHAPFYYGKAKGLYAAEGIDLEIQEGRGSAATTQAVAAKTANFGYVDVPTMMRAAVKGAPVIATGVLLQTSPMSVMGLAEKNIRKPEDIKGKTVAITPADSMTQIWPLFLKKTGLKESDFTTVAGDGQTKLNAVINGQADLLLGYVMDQSMKIKDATGKDVIPHQHGVLGHRRQYRLRQGQCGCREAIYGRDHQGRGSCRKGSEGRGAIDPRCQPEGRQDRYAGARIRADDSALPDAGNEGQAAVPGHRREHERQRQPDGRIWRA
jgi:hypothetical protein